MGTKHGFLAIFLLMWGCGSSSTEETPALANGDSADAGTDTVVDSIADDAAKDAAVTGLDGGTDSSPKDDASDAPTLIDSGSSTDADVGSAEATVEASLGDEDSAETYPAVAPSLPRVVNWGGPIIASPNIVPVFFSSDKLQDSLETFLAELAASSYWAEVTAEYGVSAPTIHKSIVVSSPAPHSTTDEELVQWLHSLADGSHAGWPKADASTIFALFYPSSTEIDVHGKVSCSWWDGYHKEDTTAGSGPLVYALMARCSPSLDALTVATAHELVAAATDPFYYTKPAFSSTDDAHFAWTLATVGEVNDLCEFEPGVNAKLVGDFMVPRSWSNARAEQGKDPCVPAVAGPYFGAQLAAPESVTIKAGAASIQTEGVHVGVGETKTVDVVLYSDGPTDSIQLQALDESHFFGGNAQLDLSLDPPDGRNGDVVHLTITANQAGAYGGSLIFLRSTVAKTGHVWIGFVEN